MTTIRVRLDDGVMQECEIVHQEKLGHTVVAQYKDDWLVQIVAVLQNDGLYHEVSMQDLCRLVALTKIASFVEDQTRKFNLFHS